MGSNVLVLWGQSTWYYLICTMISQLKVLRTTIELVALILFIYQSKVALSKYFESPNIVVSSEAPANQVLKPRYAF